MLYKKTNWIKAMGISFLILIVACKSGNDKIIVPIIIDEKERIIGTWPISGTEVPDDLASPFGPRLLSGNYDFHRGFDILAPAGTNVHSILDGTVVRAETGQIGSSLERLGKFIVIAHKAIAGTTYHQTAFLHLDEILVKKGDIIHKGDVIGKSGKTGVGINTEHLHFEYHVGANDGKISRLNTRNPLRILPYTHQDYIISAQKSNSTITININEADSSIDLVKIKIAPSGSGYSEKVIDFEHRIGINTENEDMNPYQNIYIIPKRFITSSSNYQFSLKYDGSWANLNELVIEMTDVRDSVSIKKIVF